MRLPFGLDLKTIIITLIFVWFILPMIQGALVNRRSAASV